MIVLCFLAALGSLSILCCLFVIGLIAVTEIRDRHTRRHR